MRINNIIKALPVLLAVTFHSCSKSSGPSGTTTTTVQIKNDSHFGQILTDASGNSLYFFAIDADGNSGCTGACATTWPPFNADNITSLGAGLDTADFRTITRTDGTRQTTFKGWPLYRFSGDVTTGGGGYGGTPVTNSISGDGILGIWFVAKPDYTVMLAKAQLVGLDGKSYDSTYALKTEPTLYLTDDWGVTLYSYSPDKSGKNTWTAADFSNDPAWPIVQLTAVQNVPSVMNKADFSSITVFGKPQLTFKGWPVYRFGGDQMIRGNNKGVSVISPGTWAVMDQFSEAAPE